MRRVTFSRNYTLSLSRTCQCYCKYCAFATQRAHIHAPDEVERRLDEAVRRNAKELLVLTGERPEVNPEVAARAAEWGHEDFTSYVVWACERALERGHPASHEHRRPRARRPRSAARGDRLAGPDAGVDLRAPDGHRPRRLPDQAPGAAPRDDRGGRRAEDPVHQRDPGRHRRDRGRAGRIARSVGGVARPPRPPPGDHPPELRSASALLRRARSPTSPMRQLERGGRAMGPPRRSTAEGRSGGEASVALSPTWATPGHASTTSSG